MKRRIEHEVWYRGLLVRISKFGWRLRIMPHGTWRLTHPRGGSMMCHPPRTRQMGKAIAKEMYKQERDMRDRKDREDGEWVGSVRKSSDRSRRGSEITTLVTRTAPNSRGVSCNGDVVRLTAIR